MTKKNTLTKIKDPKKEEEVQTKINEFISKNKSASITENIMSAKIC